MPTDAASARVVKRSLVIAGHRTSISLEDAFWRRLRRIALERGLSLNRLAAMVDASRGDANLSSAVRVFVLEGREREDRSTLISRARPAVESPGVERAFGLAGGIGGVGGGALAPSSSLFARWGGPERSLRGCRRVRH